MTLNSDTIDRIVAGVLNQLSGNRDAARPAVAVAVAAAPDSVVPPIEISAPVVTAELLRSAGIGAAVIVPVKAIVTPAAWDTAKERSLRIERRQGDRTARKTAPAASSSQAADSPLLIAVKNTDSVERVWTDIRKAWRRELLGCPDDAAKLAIAELTRGGVGTVVILAEQTLRAACLANRHAAVKAVPIRDLGDVRLARKQLRANVWCLDPVGRTYFEIRNIIREIAGGGK